MSTTYMAYARRDGKFWLIDVPVIERSTQARSIAEIRPMAEDLVAVMTDLDPAEFDVQVQIELPDGVQAHLAAVSEAREAEAAARSHAAAELRAAAVELKDADLSLREIGVLLGISHQRAGQLTGRAAKGTTASAPTTTSGKAAISGRYSTKDAAVRAAQKSAKSGLTVKPSRRSPAARSEDVRSRVG